MSVRSVCRQVGGGRGAASTAELERAIWTATGQCLSSLQLGTSPLHLAAQYGHYSTAEVLLRAGVSRDARTKVDRTPLHVAAADGHSHIVELLIRVSEHVSLWAGAVCQTRSPSSRKCRPREGGREPVSWCAR